jgi:hypothetical protein
MGGGEQGCGGKLNSIPSFIFPVSLPCCHKQGFFKRILWCSQGGNHPETNLANSAYMPDPSIESRNNPGSFYFLGYLLVLIVEIWWVEFFSFRNLATLDHFEKSFVLVEITLIATKKTLVTNIFTAPTCITIMDLQLLSTVVHSIYNLVH